MTSFHLAAFCSSCPRRTAPYHMGYVAGDVVKHSAPSRLQFPNDRDSPMTKIPSPGAVSVQITCHVTTVQQRSVVGDNGSTEAAAPPKRPTSATRALLLSRLLLSRRRLGPSSHTEVPQGRCITNLNSAPRNASAESLAHPDHTGYMSGAVESTKPPSGCHWPQTGAVPTTSTRLPVNVGATTEISTSTKRSCPGLPFGSRPPMALSIWTAIRW
mmetsp:Transcript_61076/g.176996  ORF Transcript_61076/g.176996 Transcript_61076/m.176996 type:complete len:214 (+) Transcript_61076:1342-1983(+)